MENGLAKIYFNYWSVRGSVRLFKAFSETSDPQL